MIVNGGVDFHIIGENIHTTRVVLKRGKRFYEDGDIEGVTYTTASGEDRLLPISDAAKRGQDYEEGRIKHVKIAVEAAMGDDESARDEGLSYIRYLVDRQEQAGATFLDINVDEISIKLEGQKAAMDWLVGTVQSMTKLPVAVDSSDEDVIAVGLAKADPDRDRPMLNSASLERIGSLDLAKQHNARVVVTAAGESGMPDGVEERLTNASSMVDQALEKGFAAGDLYVDPLIFPISVDGAFGGHALDAFRALRDKYGPDIHITGGMSNVSFGIPSRKIINDVFLILAVEAGADSGIVDPVVSRPDEVFQVDRDSPSFKLAEDVLMGRDKHCKAYIKAWRKKELAPLT
jgi:5-methyltetrahydrofolate--homocysteine methyltransferase